MKLNALASSCKTDKFSHGYTRIYEDILGSYIDRSITILEIGIKKRAKDVVGCESLHLWSKFLLRSRVIGLDIINVRDLQLLNPEFELYQVDCRKFDDISNVLAVNDIKPDVVIDDGAHTPESHQVAFAAIFSCMPSGGKYFIEDLQTCINPENFKRWEVTDENNTFKWLKDLENGLSRSVFLSPDQNQSCAQGVSRIEYFCNRKLALITKS